MHTEKPPYRFPSTAAALSFVERVAVRPGAGQRQHQHIVLNAVDEPFRALRTGLFEKSGNAVDGIAGLVALEHIDDVVGRLHFDGQTDLVDCGAQVGREQGIEFGGE